jgi:hypothetical protein
MLAYLDPGAGSSIAAVLAGGTAGVAVLYRVARERVTSRLRQAGRARARMETDTNGAGAADPVDGADPHSDGDSHQAGTPDPVDGVDPDGGPPVSADEDERSDRVRGR